MGVDCAAGAVEIVCAWEAAAAVGVDVGVGFAFGIFAVVGPGGIVVVEAAAIGGGTTDGVDGVWDATWGAVADADVDVVDAVLEREELLLGTVDGTDDTAMFCAVVVAVLVEVVAGIVRLIDGTCSGEVESFFFFFGGRPDSASLSLESLELESLELDDDESLELLLDEMFPPDGATSCFAASSAFFAFFFAVPSWPVTSCSLFSSSCFFSAICSSFDLPDTFL